VSFSVVDDPSGTVLTAFTARVDTLFGVTYIVIAPEHRYVDMVVQRASNGRGVASYVSQVAGRIGVDRLTNIGAAGRPGIVTDGLVVHPLTGQHLPMVVADYVLAEYGTGVVMAPHQTAPPSRTRSRSWQVDAAELHRCAHRGLAALVQRADVLERCATRRCCRVKLEAAGRRAGVEGAPHLGRRRP
jgi:leucyl-tRNA synthetase